MRIGEKIHELRKLSGMTQEQLAEKINISRQTISKWESGGTLPDLESVLKLCRLFDVSLDDLLEEEKKIRNEEDRLTIEDLIRINRHNQKIMLLMISGLLFFMVAAVIAAVCAAVSNATLSTQYMLYRYIVLGEYASAPMNYQVPIAIAVAAAVIGVLLIICCIVETQRGRAGR